MAWAEDAENSRDSSKFAGEQHQFSKKIVEFYLCFWGKNRVALQVDVGDGLPV